MAQRSPPRPRHLYFCGFSQQARPAVLQGWHLSTHRRCRLDPHLRSSIHHLVHPFCSSFHVDPSNAKLSSIPFDFFSFIKSSLIFNLRSSLGRRIARTRCCSLIKRCCSLINRCYSLVDI